MINVGDRLEHAPFFDPGTGELAILTRKSREIKQADTEPTPYLNVAAVRAATGEVLWETDHKA